MAAFTVALVRLKSSGNTEAVPVHDIRCVVKENGVKCYVPFEPTHEADFIVSQKHKYVVYLKDADGSIRQWYAMIVRLGASVDEVQQSAVPELRSRDQSVPTTEPNSVSDMVFHGDEMDVDSMEQNNDGSQDLPAPVEQNGAPTQNKQVTSTKSEALILDALIMEASNMVLQQQKSLQTAREEKICNIMQDIAGKFESDFKAMAKRIYKLEMKVQDIEDFMFKGGNVLQWLRNTPSESDSIPCTDHCNHVPEDKSVGSWTVLSKSESFTERA